MEFQIDRFEPGGLVVGRNGYSDVPVGTVFVALAKRRLDGEVPNLNDVDLGDVAAIELRLTEVQWFRKSLDVIPNGHAAGIRLEGKGLDTIAAVLASKREREFIFIRA
jgi:hypothetical protein